MKLLYRTKSGWNFVAAVAADSDACIQKAEDCIPDISNPCKDHRNCLIPRIEF
jgi:hypothetical protein